nr:TetR/AcrR family transcriptional regulator [Allomuricauda sp.]
MENSSRDISLIILEKAGILFAKSGIRAISMDNIATSCSISKKTIYKHFQSKEILVKIIVEQAYFENTISLEKEEISEKFYESMETISAQMKNIYMTITPIFFADSKNYFTEIYAVIKEFESILKNCFKQIISIGKNQDIISKHINDDLLIELYFNLLHNLSGSGENAILQEQIGFVNKYFCFCLLLPSEYSLNMLLKIAETKVLLDSVHESREKPN